MNKMAIRMEMINELYNSGIINSVEALNLITADNSNFHMLDSKLMYFGTKSIVEILKING